MSAQATGAITGLVTDANGVPLAAAQVHIPGSGYGAITNDAGRFLILDVPVGAVELRAELIGHRTGTKTVQIPADAAVVVDFTLVTAPIFLEEIVVAGVGRASEKRQLGNTVATIGETEITAAPISDFSQMLQARATSVTALTSDGATGSGARIRIRGSNSISMSNEPVVYVDGIRVDNSGDREGSGLAGDSGSRLDDINWEAVDRVEILKGASAATLYGSEASSGVIQIFTKEGRATETRITARAEYGLLSTPNRIAPNAAYADSPEFAQEMSDLFGIDVVPYEVFEREFTRDLLETGQTATFSADASGGSEAVQYYVGGRYFYEDGTLGGESLGPTRDDMDRVQGNASVAILPREDLRIRIASSYTNTKLNTFGRNNNTNSPTSSAMFSRPDFAECYASSVVEGATFGSTTPVCSGEGNPTGALTFFGIPTVRDLMQAEEFQESRHFTGSATADWANSSGFSVQVIAGMDQVDEDWESLWPLGWNIDGSVGDFSPDGQRIRSERTHRELTLDGRIAWATDVGSRFTSALTGGGQWFSSASDFITLAAIGFPAPGIYEVQFADETESVTSGSSKVSVGAFLQEQVGFDDWIFATLGARFDKTSSFGRSADAAFYPKAGLSVLVSEFDSWPRNAVPTLRLRAAFGRAGLQPGAFDRSTTLQPVQVASGSGLVPGNLGNPELRPERSSEFEVGVDGEAFGGRLGFDVTYWDRTTTDALVSRPYPAAGGFTEPQLSNIGRLEGHGWEFSARGVALEGDNVTLTVFANAAYISEIVTRTGVPPITVSGDYTRHRNVIAEGLAPGAFLGVQLMPACGAGVAGECYDAASQVPIDTNGDGEPDTIEELEAFVVLADVIPLGLLRPVVVDEDGDGDYYDHYLGKPTPDWQGSLGGSLALGRSFNLNTLFEYRTGNFGVSNLTRAFREALVLNTRAAAEVSSTLSNPATLDDPSLRADAARKWVTELVSLAPYSGLNLIENGNFIRWRELSLTYRPPASLIDAMKLQDLSLTLAGRNLAVWTGYSGADPEANELSRCGGSGEASVQCNFLEATDAFVLPNPRRFTLSARVVF